MTPPLTGQINLVLCVFAFTLKSFHCSAFGPELDRNDIATLTQNLKLEIDNLTSEEFLKEDYFLQNWLSLKSYDLPATVEAFTEYIEWRAKENISAILNEDWSSMRSKFPYSLDTVDKFDRPVLYIDAGLWDINSFFDEGDATYDRLVRYIFMQHEAVLTKIREMRATGKNTTQLLVISNLAGFSTFKMACFKCLQFHRHVTDIGTKFGTFSLGKAVFLNVPYFFKMVYFFLSAETRTYFELYGQDRSQWEPVILNILEESQLPAGLLAELPQKDNFDGLMHWNKEL